MTILSTLLLYGGVVVAGGLGIFVAYQLTLVPPESDGPPDRRPEQDAVDPIRTIGF